MCTQFNENGGNNLSCLKIKNGVDFDLILSYNEYKKRKEKQNRKGEKKMTKRYTVYAVCFHVTDDNEGRLAYISHWKEGAEKAVEFINKNRPERIPFTKEKIDWNRTIDFFVNEQEEF